MRVDLVGGRVVSGFLIVKICTLAACLPCTWKCVPPVDLLNGLLWVGRNAPPPTPDSLHLGSSYHLHSSHRFLSTWRSAKKEKRKKVDRCNFVSISSVRTIFGYLFSCVL